MSCAHQPHAQAEPRRYRRRQPELSVLYRLVQEHWQTYRERAEQSGPLPAFVVDEFEEYLRCGILAHGAVLVKCDDCSHERLVGLSCKGRGFCPSCLGRRMNDSAAFLTDHVLPQVPVRPWICTLPWELRYPAGYDQQLCGEFVGAFVGSVLDSLRRRAKRELGLRSVREAHTGAVTFVQRFDSVLRLDVHSHTEALDGVYVGHDGQLVFQPLGEHPVSNGLTLRTDLHRLFDRGYVTVDEDHQLVVGRRLKDDFDNGRSYCGLHGATGDPCDAIARARPTRAGVAPRAGVPRIAP